MRQELGADTVSRIDHADFRPLSGRFGKDLDGAPLRREFNRIVDEIP